MASTKYITQSLTEPAFAKLLWSKPENKRSAGKLLLVGGNTQGISAPMNAHNFATQAGIGTIRVALPKSLRAIAGQLVEQGEYLPNTPSGSFSKQGLAELIDLSQWADVVLLAGDFGKNSETAALIESFIAKSSTPTVAAKDGFDYLSTSPHTIDSSERLTNVVSLSQLQKYAKNAKLQSPITHNMTQQQLAHALEELSIGNKTFVTADSNSAYVASDGAVSITSCKTIDDDWQIKVAAYAAVWLAQQPQKIFESLTTAAYEALKNNT